MKSITLLFAVLTFLFAAAYQEAPKLPFEVFSNNRYTMAQIFELSSTFFDSVAHNHHGTIRLDQGQTVINNFSEIDANRDGAIDKAEYLAEVMKRARSADFRETGSLGREEFKTMYGHIFLHLFEVRQ